MQPVGRIRFEALEQRVLLSADVNPVFAALLVNPNEDAHITVQQVGEIYAATTNDAELDLNATAVPAGPGPSLAMFDLTVLDDLQDMPGSRVQTSTNSFALNDDTDQANFAMALQGGQVLSLTRSATGDLDSTVNVIDANGNTIGSIGSGEQVVNGIQIVDPGTYTVIIVQNSGSGVATVAAALNAVLEEESLGGTSNDDIATAQSLDASAISSVNGGVQYSVIGEASDNQTDVYSFSVVPGDIVSVWVETRENDWDINDVRVLDGDGKLITDYGLYGDETDARFTGNILVRDGIDRIYVEISTYDDYNLFATSNITPGGDAEWVDYIDLTATGFGQGFAAEGGGFNGGFGGGIEVGSTDGVLEPLSVEPDDTFAEANYVFVPNERYPYISESGSIQNVDGAGDQDIYAIELEAGDWFEAYAWADDSSWGMHLRLYDEFGNVVTLDNEYDGDDWYDIYGNVDSTGTYYLVVTGAGNEDYDPNTPYSGSAGEEGQYRLDFYLEKINYVSATTYFTLDVVQGDEISLTTLTPDDLSGRPNEFPDPVIEFGNSSMHGSTLVVTDASDGRNATYAFTAQFTGEVRFSVHSELGEGTFQVMAEGSSVSALSPPNFNGSNLPVNGSTRSIGNTVFMYFNEVMHGGDVDPEDLLVNGVAANSAFVQGYTVRFDIEGLITEDGEYNFELVADGLSSLEGGVFGGTSFTVNYDTTGPSLVSSSPGNGDIIDPGETEIALQFSEDVNAFSITPSSFSLVETTGGATQVIAGVTRIDNRNVVLNLGTPLEDGIYQLNFETTNYGLRDVVGNNFTTASIGFVVDSGDIALDDLLDRIGAPGLGSFGTEIEGTLFDENDVDTYTFSLASDQAVGFLVSSVAETDALVTLVDSEGTEIWSSTASGLGAPAAFGPDTTLAAGNYAIKIAGVSGSGNYAMLFTVNTDFEDEALGGASNDDRASAQTPEMLRSVGGGLTTTVVGTLDSANSDTADFYAVTLGSGERLDVVGSAIDGAAQIELLGPDGTLITKGAVTEDGSASIGNFVAPAAGTYFLRVSSPEGSDATRYQIGLSIGIALQIPLDNQIFDANGLSSLIGGLGVARGFGGNARIAVVGVSSYTDRFQQIVDQLNDSSVFSFDATLVFGADVDTTQEIEQFDLIILSNTGFGTGTDALGSVAALLPDYVSSGGGVILTGWGVYGSSNETSANRAALEQVLPVRLSGGYSYYSGSTNVFDATHPVTQGLGTVSSSYVEYPRSGLAEGAVALAGTTSNPTVAVREVGLGRTVYLGPTYTYNNTNITGAADTLIEQAAAWAGGANRLFQATLDLVAGQEISLETATPADDAGLPVNDGDLVIRLFAADGSLVAQNADGAADGRNALLTYTVPEAGDGRYVIEIGRESGVVHADILLTIDGNPLDIGPLMTVVDSVPDDGEPMQAGTNLIDINFSQMVDASTVDIGDLTVDGDAVVTSVELLDGDTIRFTLDFPEGDKGYNWSMAAGAVTSISGVELAAAAGSFIVDETAPWVTTTNPESTSGTPFNQVTFVFDEAVEPTSARIEDIVSFTRPDGASLLSSVIGVDVNGAEVTVRFSDQYQEGAYTLTIGPNILDLSGNPMQSPDGTQDQFTATIRIESPDLEVTNIVIPENIEFGVAFDLTYTVTNTGGDPASGNWSDRIYLANTGGGLLRTLTTVGRATVDDTGSLLPPLQPGASYTQTVSVVVPVNSGYDEGAYQIAVRADIYGGQNEADENNNTSFSAGNLTFPALVDLVVEPFAIPASAVSGQELPITWTVTNQGDKDFSGTFYDRIYLSGNGTSLNTYLGQFSYTGPLAAGESVTRVQTVTLPDTLEGMNYVRILTDYLGNVEEGPGEDNNAQTSDAKIDITLREFPNLVVTSIERPDEAFSSAPITIEWTVENIGDAATNAPYWYDAVYLSLDDVVGNDDDIYLGRATNPSFLNAGGTYRNSLTANLPRGIEGPYFINVRADIYDYVEEHTNEGDNGLASAVLDISLTPPPDLQVTNVISPSQAFSGTTTGLTYTVTNEGDGRTLESRWYDRVWLSEDDVIDSDDVYLGQFLHNGQLESGASYDNTVSVRLPVGTSGDYLFLVETDSYGDVYENVYEDNNLGYDTTSEGAPDFTTINLTPPPDLEIVLLDQPDPFYSGRAQTLTYEVANIGATSTLNGYRLDRVYLSDDGTLDDTDTLVGQAWRYGYLASGDFTEYTISVTLPDGVLGDSTLILVTDADNREFEVNKDNNEIAVDIEAQILAADLRVTSFTASDTGEAGGAITLDWTVENFGEGDTVDTAWTDQIVVSTDQVLGNGDDRVIHTLRRTAGALAPAESYSQTGIVAQLPFDLEGPYFLFLKTDSASEVFENAREGNNISAPQAITIIRNTSDLVTSDVTFAGPDLDAPTEITAGRNLSVSYTVTNEGLGNTEATRWYDGIYLSLDGSLDPAEDILVGRYYRVNRLDSGQSYTATQQVFVPIVLPEGNYRVLVKSDLYDAVDEEDTVAGNNIAASDETLAVAAYDNGVIDAPTDGSDPYAGLTPDLVVESVTASDTGFSGQNITVNWTVRNDGPQVTGPRSWYDTVYLSLDQTLDTGSDIRLGYVYHQNGLDVDGSYDVSRSFTVPRGLAGDWFVFVRTDAGSSIGEVDEMNNSGLSASPTSLVLPAPSDLVAGAITVPETGVLGAPVTFDYTVTNEGANSVVGSWQDSFYLSLDDEWDIDDAFITSVNRSGPVASGESYTGTVTAALPGVLPGDYKIIVRSDIRNAVPESDETNNEAPSEDSIAADAQLLDLGSEVTGTLAAGQAIYFKIALPEDETVRVTLDREGTGASEIYAAFDGVPSRSDFDASARDPFATDQIMIIPSSQAGDYYIMVYGQSGQSTNFTLLAETVPFSLTTTDPTEVGNSGLVTLEINGARFSDDTVFELVDAEGEVLSSFDVIIENSAKAFARFAMAGTPVGTYDLRATRGDLVVELEDAILVSAEKGDASMLVNITGPDRVRPDRVNSFQVNFANTGGSDTRAPLILVTSSADLAMGVSGDRLQRGGLQILGSDVGAPIDIFRPGAESAVSVVYRTESSGAGVGMNARAITAEDANEIEDFDAIEAQIRPADLSDADWNTFWQRIQPRIGTTWGQYVSFVNDVATYVQDATGETSRDVREMITMLYAINPDYLPNVSVSGQLVNSGNGNPVSNVSVLAYLATERGFVLQEITTTESDGTFNFGALRAGTYQLSLAGPVEDGLLTEAEYGFDLDLDGIVDSGVVLAEVPEGEDTENLTLQVTLTPDAAALRVAQGPVTATDSAGRLHMVWSQDGTLVHSVNEGSGWSAPREIIASGEEFRDVEIHVREGVNSGEDALLIVWMTGEGNESRILYAAGERQGGGDYLFSSSAVLTDDALFYSDVAVGIDSNGEAVFLFSKTDAENAQADADIYTKTLSNEQLALPLTITLEVDDLDLFEAYLGSLSQESLDEFIAFRYRKGITFGNFQLRLDATLNATDTKATISINGAGRGEWKFFGGRLKIEGEGRVGAEAGWYVDEDKCSWEFDWGRLNFTASVAASVRAEPIIRAIFPATAPALFLADIFGVEIWARFEGSLSGKLNYDAWSQLPFSPTDASGKGRIGAGFSVERESWFVKGSKLTVRGLINFNFDGKAQSPYFELAANDPITASVLFRKQYIKWGRTVFDDYTFTFGGANSPLQVAGASFDSYTLLDLASGAVISNTDPQYGEESFVREITFGDGPAGSLDDLSSIGETAVTQTLTNEASPVMAQSVGGTLTGVWLDEEGISVSDYVTGSGAWSVSEQAVNVGDYDIRDLEATYDGDGDLMLMWNRIDTSGIVDGITPEELDLIVQSGGDLMFAVRDAATGEWGEALVLQGLSGRERNLSTHRMASGDVLATWVYQDDTSVNEGQVNAAIWNAATNTWSTPETLGGIPANETPSASELDGRPVVIWSQTVEVAGTVETGAALQMVELFNGSWRAVEMETLRALLATEGDSGELFETSLWNVEGDLPEPDEEKCECEDDDCDDDDDDDYDPPVQRPSDPNDILGPDGFGEENWVTTEDPYGFKIRFENEPTATAPAQVVVITQEFDTDLNINSFRVDDFGWGDLIFEVDATSPFFVERYDFTESHGYFVDVVAGIDVITGIATWTISTIDPETGEPPLDAQAGFLPINDDTGIGEGFVSYTIAAGRRVETGTRVDSVARIVFDTEAPIDTPAIFHTLDTVAPTSAVNPLPDRSEDTDVLVSWQAQDDEGGSAVGGVSVYVSTNGGESELWLEDTTLTEAVWTGELGNTYSFYSIARDNAGWVEDAPDVADATVAVGAQPGVIAGIVFNDLDGDGLAEDGEPGLANLIVYLDLDGSGEFDEADIAVLSDGAGAYSFEGLQPGTYSVGAVLPDGLTLTGPSSILTDVEVLADTTSEGPSFGLFQPGTISGTIFRDGSGPQDGVRDGGETGLSGWAVYIDANDNNIHDDDETRVFTDTAGRFTFDGLVAGTVKLRVDAETGYSQTAPADGFIEVNVISGLDASGLEFGFLPDAATITGTKFEDINGNGQRDNGESGLAGWTVYIDANGDGNLNDGETFTVTDENGTYVFTDLQAGTYIVAEVPQDGWVQTFPGAEPFTINGHTISTSSVQIALDLPATAQTENIDLLTAQGADWADDLAGMTAFWNDADFADITGSRTTVVTIDSGIDLDHSFFGPDADNNGRADRIVFSYDFADGDANASDVSGHGTGVAGIIAGNDSQYGGIAPEADIISLKVFSDSGAGYFADLERALQWVVLHGESYDVSVVNLSIGDGGNWSDAVGRYGLGDELAALADMDVIVIAASGNSYASFDTEGVAYPAADPSVIGVGAVWAGDYGGPWYFSNGATDYTTDADRITAFTQRDDDLLDILAPGARFVTAGRDGGLASVQGTSHAAAYMSGIATLAQDLALREFGHRLSAAEFSALLSQTAIFVLDGDDEDDNVQNTGLAFPRVDMAALADAIMTFVPGSLDENTGGDTGNDGNGELLAAAGQYSVSVVAGETVSNVDFGSFEQVTLNGVVFDDDNLDGVFDTDEAAVEGIVVYVDANEDGVLNDTEQSTLTDANGVWSIGGGGPGTETVRMIAPDGITPTVSVATIDTSSGTDVSGINFGLDIPSDPVGTLTVSEVTATRDGFIVRFSEAIDTTQISTNGDLADVVLRNAAGEIVRGSLIFDTDEQGFRFVATRATLTDSSFTLTLKSGEDGFVGSAGTLDGNADGTNGDDFAMSLTGPDSATAVLSIDDFARAAGQSLAIGTVMPGIPLTLSGASGLTSMEFTLGYDPAILTDIAVVADGGLPLGAVLETLSQSDGNVLVRLTLTAPLAQDELVIGYLTGEVAADAPFASAHLVDLTLVAVAGVDAVSDDDGMHVVALAGDVDLDGAYTFNDLTMIDAIALGSASGSGEGTLDAAFLADIDSDGDVDLNDSMVAFRASLGVYDPTLTPPPGTVSSSSGSFDLSGGSTDFGLDAGSGSSVTSDPFGSTDPFASNDPFGSGDPFASSVPFGSGDPVVSGETATDSDPFASFSTSSTFADPFGTVSDDTTEDPFATATSSTDAFGAFPPFPW